jgi:hyaluronoglucosaminidase
MTSAFFSIRGVVEGFYGFYYTYQERLNLIRFMGRHGFNMYLYAPKNDRYHRDRWREAYPPQARSLFLDTIQVASENKIRFCYGISPGTSICYTSTEDFGFLTEKITFFYELGIRDFSLLLDDILPEFTFKGDSEQYESYADAHADLCNQIYDWLISQDTSCTLSMCPTDYADRPPFSTYTKTLGQKLIPEIMVMYTGVDVCAKEISTLDTQAYRAAIQRKPLIWDNYPVNDGDMAADLHLGPIQGRDPYLYKQVSGILVNPMNQMEASKIALLTYADYMANPIVYDPQTSWQRALQEAAGAEFAQALQRLAENALKSPLKTPNAVQLERLVTAVLQAYKMGDLPKKNRAGAALEDYLNKVDQASYDLANYLQNDALRSELLPWLDLWDWWRRLGKNTLRALTMQKLDADFPKVMQAIQDAQRHIQKHPKRIMGNSLMILVEYLSKQYQDG